MIKPYFETKLGKLYHGDCLEIMKEFPKDHFDLCLTDPPYNAKNIGPNKKEYDICEMQMKDYKNFCKKWFKKTKRISRNIVFTPGIANISNYPQPYWIICWHKPAAYSFNRMGGFNAWEPIFIYGKPTKRIGQDYVLVNTLNFSKGPEKDHPCPKVFDLWWWLVYHFTDKDYIVLDPLIGSGTTGVVCENLGIRWVGIEMSERYCEITKERTLEASQQKKLFPLTSQNELV